MSDPARDIAQSRPKAFTVVESVFGKLETALLVAAAVTTLLMMVLITVDVVARYFFNSPIRGGYNMVGALLMPAGLWFAVSYTHRVGRHVGVRAFASLQPRTQALIRFIPLLVAAALFGLVAGLAWMNAVERIGQINYELTFPISQGTSWIILAIGSSLLTVRILLNAISEVIWPSDDRSSEEVEIAHA